jgi:hypothetical protein
MMSSLVIGGPGAYIPYPSHSFLTDMGPDQWMLMLDCRSVYWCHRFSLRVLMLYLVPNEQRHRSAVRLSTIVSGSGLRWYRLASSI